MLSTDPHRVVAPWRVFNLFCAFGLLLWSGFASAAGTAAGTVIENTATVDFNLGGTPLTLDSNTTSLTVVERLDVNVTLQSPQLLVQPGATGRALLFTVTNTGNGSEAFQLAIDSAVGGGDFDPVPAVPAIYFDTDASGDFNVGDIAYDPGNNDPVLAADESVSVFIVNDIPGTTVNGNVGRSQLSATATTGAGAPGTAFAGQGDNGVTAVVGSTGASAIDVGEYLVADVQVNVVKSQLVTDPFGGNEPIPGATITYTISVEVVGAGTATAATVRDAIPTYTTFVAGSITLDAAPLTDASGDDEGELDTSGGDAVVVRLGDLDSADGQRIVRFQVTID